jgi:hypothetical protein
VAVLTILVNGLTMAPPPRVLRIGNPEAERVQYEVARGGLQVVPLRATPAYLQEQKATDGFRLGVVCSTPMARASARTLRGTASNDGS